MGSSSMLPPPGGATGVFSKAPLTVTGPEPMFFISRVWLPATFVVAEPVKGVLVMLYRVRVSPSGPVIEACSGASGGLVVSESNSCCPAGRPMITEVVERSGARAVLLMMVDPSRICVVTLKVEIPATIKPAARTEPPMIRRRMPDFTIMVIVRRYYCVGFLGCVVKHCLMGRYLGYRLELPATRQ